MEMVNIINNLDKNEEFLRNTIGESIDTNYRRFNIIAFNNKTALLVYISGLVDVKVISDFILTPLMALKQLQVEISIQDKTKPITWLMNSGISLSNATESNQWTDIGDVRCSCRFNHVLNFSRSSGEIGERTVSNTCYT